MVLHFKLLGRIFRTRRIGCEKQRLYEDKTMRNWKHSAPLAGFLFAVGSSFTAAAERPQEAGTWYLYSLDSSGAEYYVGMESYRVNGSRAGMATYVSKSGGGHTILLELFDCVTREFVLAQKAEYDRNGTVISKSGTQPGEPLNWKRIDPVGRDRISMLPGILCKMTPPFVRTPAEAEEEFRFYDDEVTKMLSGRGR